MRISGSKAGVDEASDTGLSLEAIGVVKVDSRTIGAQLTAPDRKVLRPMPQDFRVWAVMGGGRESKRDGRGEVEVSQFTQKQATKRREGRQALFEEERGSSSIGSCGERKE